MCKDNRPQKASLNSESFLFCSPRAFFVAAASFLVATICPTFAGQSVSLSWETNPEPGVAGYKVYYGTSRKDIKSIDVGDSTKATVSGLKEKTTYYFAVTAYNNAAWESEASDRLSYKTGSSSERNSELLVNGGDGSGRYPIGSQVRIHADRSPKGKSFSAWTGDTGVISNPFIRSTSATVTSLDVLLKANYSR